MKCVNKIRKEINKKRINWSTPELSKSILNNPIILISSNGCPSRTRYNLNSGQTVAF